MNKLNFRNEAGDQVWKNVKGVSHLLDKAEIYHLLSGRERSKAKRNLIAWLMLAAFKHKNKPNTLKIDIIKYIKNYQKVDRRFFKLYCRSGESRSIEFNPEVRPEPLSVGVLVGYSCVVFLNSDAFDLYIKSDMTPFDINASLDSVGFEFGHPFIYIKSAVNISSIPHLGKYNNNSTSQVLGGLLSQVGRFLAPFDYDAIEDRFVPRENFQLPKVVCDRDDRAMADSLITGMGFTPLNQKFGLTFEKFLLDFDAYNNEKANDKNLYNRERIRNAYYIIRHHLKWWDTRAENCRTSRRKRAEE